jgi:hypothetical protein
MYEERFYRAYSKAKFVREVSHKESDLYVASDSAIDEKLLAGILKKYYRQIEEYIEKNPGFATSLSPLEVDIKAPAIIQDMLKVSGLTGIGPFASVAGAVAYYVGREILRYADEVIIENGGDLFLKINEDKRIGVYLGDRFALKAVTLKIKKRTRPFGIASSSSSIGHSLNFGKADLLTVIARDAIIADGFATALSNRIQDEAGLCEVMNLAQVNDAISGMLIFFGGKIYLWGELEIESS